MKPIDIKIRKMKDVSLWRMSIDTAYGKQEYKLWYGEVKQLLNEIPKEFKKGGPQDG